MRQMRLNFLIIYLDVQFYQKAGNMSNETRGLHLFILPRRPFSPCSASPEDAGKN